MVKESTYHSRRHRDEGFPFWCWEDPLEKEMAIHSSILSWVIPWIEGLRASVHGVTKNQTKLSYWACTHQTFILPQFCFFTFQIKVVEKADLGSRLPSLIPWLQPFLGV